jgi:hypothetical protein
MLRIPIPAVEAGLSHGLPLPGSRTAQLKVLDQHADAHSLTLELAAPGGSQQTLHLRVSDPRAKPAADGAELGATGTLRDLRVSFPPGSGYQQKTVTIRW